MNILKRIKAFFNKKQTLSDNDPYGSPLESEVKAQLTAYLKSGQVAGWSSTAQESIDKWMQYFLDFNNNPHGDKTLTIGFCSGEFGYCYDSIPYSSISYLDYRATVLVTEVSEQTPEEEESVA